MAGWIDTRTIGPTRDGEYMIQKANGIVEAMMYTTDGGWNTYRDSDGTLHNNCAMDYRYVVRWFDVPAPSKVPAEWYEEWLHS